MTVVRGITAFALSLVTLMSIGFVRSLVDSPPSIPERLSLSAVALSPPLETATFKPTNFDKPGHLAAFRSAHKAWLKNTTTPMPPWISPDQVEESIRYAERIEHAIMDLCFDLNWKPSPSTLKAYMTKYGIHAPWRPYDGKIVKWLKANSRRPRVDPRIVQEIMGVAANEGELLKSLERQYDWSLSPVEFRKFRKKYHLQIPPQWSAARLQLRASVAIRRSS